MNSIEFSLESIEFSSRFYYVLQILLNVLMESIEFSCVLLCNLLSSLADSIEFSYGIY